jgi:hypothetical protein
MARFACDKWQHGQACERYIETHWTQRWLGALIGAAVAVWPLAKSAHFALPDGLPAAIALGTFIGALPWAFIWLAAVVFALHREHDFLACLVTGFGIPGLIYTLFVGANALG